MKMNKYFTDDEIVSLIATSEMLSKTIEGLYIFSDTAASILTTIVNRIVEIGQYQSTDATQKAYDKCKKIMLKFDKIKNDSEKLPNHLANAVESLDNLIQEQRANL